MAVKLRCAAMSDVPAMQTCALRAYAEARASLTGLPDVASGMAEDVARHIAFVAESSGRCAGFLIAADAGEALKLVNLAVDPEFAGRGIARGLLEKIEQIARDAGKKSLTLVTHAGMTKTLAIYHHLGWRETRRTGAALSLAKRL